MIQDPSAPIFLPVAIDESDLHFDRVLKSLTNKHLNEVGFIENSSPHWPAEAFGLNNVGLFSRLDVEGQKAVLQKCSDDLLREACFIEIAGMSYTAKMSLSSNVLSERIFYSLIGAEEAKHFSQLKPFVAQSVLEQGPDHFTTFIGEIISDARREEAIFLIQVLLEGWGLNHFSWMNSGCATEPLRDVFRGILRDEARHHAGGVALLTHKFTPEDKKIVNWLSDILNMVRIGPVRLLQAITDVTGALSADQQRLIFEQLGAYKATQSKLDLLQKLLLPCVDEKLLAQFEEGGLFEPA
jgi:hypothetical protein